MEVWKAIPGYEGFYEASDQGSIRSIDRVVKASNRSLRQKGRVLKFATDPDGYRKVALCTPESFRSFSVHRLVALTFLGPRPDKYHINHINGIKADNSVTNLEYCTQSENALHSFRLGLQKPKRGSLNGHSKLTEEQVKTIRVIAARGGRYYGRKDLAQRFGVAEATIKEVVTRRKNGWKHV